MLLVIFQGEDMVNHEKSRTVGVPRGLLKFLVLKMISEKPMSGVEIVDEIEKQTGSWKPSSGSIYPLLSSLQKKGYTKELPSDELGIKRYSFTDEGKAFFVKQKEFGKEFIKKIEFLAPMLVGGFDPSEDNIRFRGSKEYVKKLMKSLFFLRHNAERLSDKDVEDLIDVVKDCSLRLEKIIKRHEEAN